jgi:Na+-transporting methylmalonyl-CoA/oxaloacetate decarboxylase gamma subunit
MKKLLALALCMCGMTFVVAEEVETPAAEEATEEVAAVEKDDGAADVQKVKKPAQEEKSACASCPK